MATDPGLLTAEMLRRELAYDKETGVFSRLTCRFSSFVGKPTGSVNKVLGYVFISVLGHSFLAHRLAFLWMTGEWPGGQIDHMNGDRTDNRWCNLRDCGKERFLNGQNRRIAARHSKTGILGVTKIGRRWQASIAVGRKTLKLGYFSTSDEAAHAYVVAKRRYHPGCTL